MKKLALLLFACGCSTSTTSTDAGSEAGDATSVDLCDLDRFLDSGGAGNPCPFASARLCFHAATDCPLNGCKCAATAMGPRWQCTTDIACKDSGVPEDAGTDAPSDAGGD